MAVRWYLRYGLSNRDVEELLAERGITVDHVTVYRWVPTHPIRTMTTATSTVVSGRESGIESQSSPAATPTMRRISSTTRWRRTHRSAGTGHQPAGVGRHRRRTGRRGGASGSVALLGDTLHNFADALTAVPLFVAFTLATRAADKRYTYGYGRAEDLGGVFVVVLITPSGGWPATGDPAADPPQHVTHLWAVAVAAVVGFAGNELVARYRIRAGRRIGPAALVADGLHARTDGFTCLAVLLGAGGLALGWRWADPVVGLVITVAILGVLRSALNQVGPRLMDAVDPGLVDQARSPELESRECTRCASSHRRIGHTLRAEADLTVSQADVAGPRPRPPRRGGTCCTTVRRLTAATVIPVRRGALVSGLATRGDARTASKSGCLACLHLAGSRGESGGDEADMCRDTAENFGSRSTQGRRNGQGPWWSGADKVGRCL